MQIYLGKIFYSIQALILNKKYALIIPQTSSFYKKTRKIEKWVYCKGSIGSLFTNEIRSSFSAKSVNVFMRIYEEKNKGRVSD